MCPMAQPLLACFQPVIDWLETVTGGWDNLLQGALGSALGVLGAFWIAVSMFKREVARERQASRETNAVQAAGNALKSLGALSEAYRRVTWLEPGKILARHLEAWEKAIREFKDDIATEGHLLPRALEDQLVALGQTLGSALPADFDEDGTPLYIERGTDDDLRGITDGITAAQKSLQDYRRAPTDPAVSA